MATYPTNPASTFLQATDLAVFASNQLYDFVNGDITVSIETEEGGDIPSVAKALHEAAAYREPIAWSNGAVQTDLVQPRDFNNTIYVPRLVPVTLGASPTTGPSGEWRILFRGAPATVTDTTTNNHTATTHTHELDLSAVTSAAAIGYDNTTSGLVAAAVQSALDEIKSSLDSLRGSVQAFATSSAPSGWLKADGSAVSRTTYSALFAAIGTTHGSGDGSTTFNLPDLRGEFIRGFDDGRGVDSGRALGSTQKGTLVAWDSDPGEGVYSVSTSDAGSSGSEQVGADLYSLSDYPDAVLRGVTSTAVTSLPGSSEGYSGVARPRNVAFLYCIKY